MDTLELLIKENLKFFLIISFISCGCIEGIKRSLNRLIEVILISNEKKRTIILYIARALYSFLPIPFGIHLGDLLFVLSESQNKDERTIYIYIMLGLIYIMYFFLFKTIIERLKSLAKKWKGLN